MNNAILYHTQRNEPPLYVKLNWTEYFVDIFPPPWKQTEQIPTASSQIESTQRRHDPFNLTRSRNSFLCELLTGLIATDLIDFEVLALALASASVN